MSIVCQLTRDSRVREIPGCPLTDPRPGVSQTACAGCPYNALAPKKPRIGCVYEVSTDSYRAAMNKLEARAPKDARRLHEILDAQRDRSPDGPLSAEELREVQALVQRWWSLVSNDPAEREVAAVLLRFADLAVERREPVRLLG